MGTPVQGLAETYSLFDRIPQAAREQLAVEEARISYEILAAQRRDVPKRTGALEAGLSLQLMIEQLRVRVGLLGVKAKTTRAKGANLLSLFYGRVVEFGRRAQTVIIGRGPRAGKKMRVSALAARPYILVERPEIRADQRLADFWGQVMTNAGTAT